MNGVAFQSQRWHGYAADEEWAAECADLEAWLSAHSGTLIVHYSSREVRKLATPLGVVYLKLIRGLTDAGYEGKEWFSWCKWVFRPSRALWTWKISQRLLEDGFACPVPVLAARKREKGYPTDVFVASEIPFPNLWDDPGEPLLLAALLAAETKRFHEAGFAHGDYILRNLCLNPKTRHLVFLDNDRTWRPPFFVRGYYQRRNLHQLSYSLLKRFEDSAVPRAFLKYYYGDEDGAIAGILQAAEARWKRNRH